eukprot:6171906-Pleurochrysis_carterae.AAC.1
MMDVVLQQMHRKLCARFELGGYTHITCMLCANASVSYGALLASDSSCSSMYYHGMPVQPDAAKATSNDQCRAEKWYPYLKIDVPTTSSTYRSARTGCTPTRDYANA